MNENKYYIVKSIRLMTHLIRDGFNLYKVEDSRDNPHFKIFLFEDCSDLRASITKFTNKN